MVSRRSAAGVLPVKRPAASLIMLLIGLFAIVFAVGRFDVLAVPG